METTVICHALLTVKQTHVKYMMVPVLNVSLDGTEQNVTLVYLYTIYFFVKSLSALLQDNHLILLR